MSQTSITHQVLELVDNVKKKLTDKQYKDIVELLQKQHKNLEKKPYYLTAVAPVIRVRKDDGGCCGYSLTCELQSFKFVAHLSDEGLKKLKEFMNIDLHHRHINKLENEFGFEFQVLNTFRRQQELITDTNLRSVYLKESDSFSVMLLQISIGSIHKPFHNNSDLI